MTTKTKAMFCVAAVLLAAAWPHRHDAMALHFAILDKAVEVACGGR